MSPSFSLFLITFFLALFVLCCFYFVRRNLSLRMAASFVVIALSMEITIQSMMRYLESKVYRSPFLTTTKTKNSKKNNIYYYTKRSNQQRKKTYNCCNKHKKRNLSPSYSHIYICIELCSSSSYFFYFFLVFFEREREKNYDDVLECNSLARLVLVQSFHDALQSESLNYTIYKCVANEARKKEKESSFAATLNSCI